MIIELNWNFAILQIRLICESLESFKKFLDKKFVPIMFSSKPDLKFSFSIT